MVGEEAGTRADPAVGARLDAYLPADSTHLTDLEEVFAMTRLFIGTEKETLLAFLDQEREVVLWKLDGLTDDQLRRRPLTASRLYLLGLVKHLAAGEQYWLCQLLACPAEPLSLAASDDVELDEGDTTHSVLAYYARARAASDRVITERDLDTTATTWIGDTVTLRWAILHMIEETARHAGHADLIRERIDHTTGYLPENLPY